MLKKLHILTKRLEIRNLASKHLKYFHAYRSNPEVTKYQGFDVMNKEECANFIESQRDKLFGRPGEWVQYGVINRASNILLGDCAIKLQKDDPRIAEIGITISQSHHQKGYAREALMGILSFLFDQNNIHRVQEIVDTENLASIKLLESIGFRKEGHFIENIFFNGKWGSEYQYAMLNREWKKKKNEISVETYNKSAKQYQDRFMEMDLYNDTYDNFCKLIKAENPRILEIATGPGNVSAYLLENRNDFNLTGIDLAPNMVELAKKNVPNANFLMMDCRDVSQFEGNYDAIMCGFCMPYLSKEECVKLIEDSAALLKENGIVYFSTMEDDYEKSGYETTSFTGEDKVHIYYHQEVFLSEQLIKSGFKIVEIQRKKFQEPDGSFLTDMIFIARKAK